jgi:hypothetical protein
MKWKVNEAMTFEPNASATHTGFDPHGNYHHPELFHPHEMIILYIHVKHVFDPDTSLQLM